MTTDELVVPGPASRSRWARSAGRALAELAGLALPVACAGCDEPDVGLCRACRAAVRGSPRAVALTAWPDAPPARAAASYAGPVRSAVVAWKDGGRHDLTGVLARSLADAVLALPGLFPQVVPAVLPGPSTVGRAGLRPELGWAGPGPPFDTSGAVAVASSGSSRVARRRSPSVVLVPIPSSRAARRRRGEQLVVRLALLAARHVRRAGGAVEVLPALVLVRRVADQSGLDRSGRGANLDHALAVRPAAAAVVAGRHCVVVDDILTTGVTVREACRALGEVGARPSGIAICCATPLRRGLSGAGHLH